VLRPALAAFQGIGRGRAIEKCQLRLRVRGSAPAFLPDPERGAIIVEPGLQGLEARDFGIGVAITFTASR
jgi:hypothetical protein